MSIDFAEYGKVALNQLTPGKVLFAHVPFKDEPGRGKTRPVVVIERRGRAVVACAMFSAQHLNSIKAIRHQRTCYIDPRAILIDRYDFVALDSDDLDDPTWDILADNVIWGDL